MKLLLAILVILSCMQVRATASQPDSILVHFEFNESVLSNEAKDQLSLLIPAAIAHQGKIKIYGHTDQIGTEAYNDKLSIQRAETVRDYFIGAGIDRTAIVIVQGKGENQLISTQMDEASRQKNRRVLLVHETKAMPTPAAETVQTDEPKLVDIVQNKDVKVGDKLILKHINFEGSRHVFLESAWPALRELLEVMKTMPNLKIAIEGHICCFYDMGDAIDLDLGTPNLSYQRAKAVYQYLVKNGIDPARMTYQGFARKFPITEERTEEEAVMNRRVEIRILSK